MQKQQLIRTRKSTSESAGSSNIKLVLLNIAIYLIVFIAASLVSYIEGVEFDLFYPISLSCLAVSSFLSGMIAGRKKRENGLINGILYALPSVLIVLIVSLLINKFTFDFCILLSILLSLIFAGIGGIVSVNHKRKIKIK